MKMHRGAKWVVAAVAMVLLAGSLATGSNMGFKFNAEMVTLPGVNWLSLPLNNPYALASDVCTQLGLEVDQIVRRFDQTVNGDGIVFPAHFCSQPANDYALVKGGALQINDVNGFTGGSAIIVGSHDPTFVYNLVDQETLAPGGQQYVSIPYHTTAVLASDICSDIGLVSTLDQVRDVNPNTGVPRTHFCTSGPPGTGNDYPLVTGRGVQLQITVNIAWIPSHF